MTIKLAFIACAVCAVTFGIGGYMLGRFLTPSKMLSIKEQGKLEYREQLPFVPTTNSGICCAQYNSVLGYLNVFMSAVPIVDDVTPDTIRFRILSNRYSLTYRLNDIPTWHFAPMASVRLRMTSAGFAFSLGGGVMVDYANIGGGIIVNGLFPTHDIDLTAFGFIRF